MNNMRKWINLIENDQLEDNWYSDADVTLWFSETAKSDIGGSFYKVRSQWFDLFGGAELTLEKLYIAQDFFQKHVKVELKPAWITDMRFDKGSYFWKIERGPNDPDE